MRLVDADALCVHIENEFDGVCVFDVSGNEAAREFCDMVDVAPTIDAIPVEWLRERKHWAAIDGDHWAENIISHLLDAWQKEQEAQDE